MSSWQDICTVFDGRYFCIDKKKSNQFTPKIEGVFYLYNVSLEITSLVKCLRIDLGKDSFPSSVFKLHFSGCVQSS